MVKKIAENFNRLSRAHQRHIRQTDGTATAYSKREREFTLAKNGEIQNGDKKWLYCVRLSSSHFVCFQVTSMMSPS